VAPVAAEYELRTGPIELLLIMNLAIAALGYDTSRGVHWLLGVVALIVLLRILARWVHVEAVDTGASALSGALTVFAAYNALMFAVKGRTADAERLTAALSAYLLAGYFFGITYFEVNRLRPGSFAVGGTPIYVSGFDLQTAVYFSFVTLATLGYGDIAPLTPIARGMAVAEAIIGQLYLAVLIARLVGQPAARGDSQSGS
jgi:hypothetical protein